MASGRIYDDKGFLNKLETKQKNMNISKNIPERARLFIETTLNENKINIKYGKIETEKNTPAHSNPIPDIDIENKNKDKKTLISRSPVN